jgi:hypothetical protein
LRQKQGRNEYTDCRNQGHICNPIAQAQQIMDEELLAEQKFFFNLLKPSSQGNANS